MKKLHLYLDTTVWNYPFVVDAPEYRRDTLDFFQRTRFGAFRLFDSSVVAEEIAQAPERRLNQVVALLEEFHPERLPLVPEVERLAELYLRKGALPKKSRADAFHVAFSTYYQMDALLSWNFKHLANISRRARLVAVNLEQGYGEALNIVTPLGVLDDEKYT